MPRPKSLIPTYRLHKPSGKAVAYVGRKCVYLGEYGTPESRAAYSRLIADLEADPGKPKPSARRAAAPAVTLNTLFRRFATEELPRYSTAEQFCLKSAIRCARELFGETAAAEFGPLRLRTVREAMIRKGWSRSFINKEIKRLRLIIRWGISFELVPQSVADALASVKALGHGEAPESRPRRAIPEADLKAVRAVLSPLHGDIFDLMLMTGCRPGELLGLTTGMIDRSGETWRAELASHKTRHQGKSRTLHFNATAQAILLKYLQADPAALIFPLKRVSFGNAVKRACEVAFGMPDHLRNPDPKLSGAKLAAVRAEAKAWRREHVFTPHWLRHTVATRLADEVGTEGAQRLLGHATRAMTEHYSKGAERQAIDAVKKLG